MPITLSPFSQSLPAQRTEAHTVQAGNKTEQIKKIGDQALTNVKQQELTLKGYDQVESMALLQTTGAALASGQEKLQAALTRQGQGERPADELADLAAVIHLASFQGQPLLAEDTPVLEQLTRLSDNPPYFMTSAREAVDLFRQLLAEKLESELKETSQGVPLGDALAGDLKQEVARLLDQPNLTPGQSLTAGFTAQGMDFNLNATLADSESFGLHLDKDSYMTTVVNGNELLLQGPFVKLVGPVSEDELLMPRSKNNQSQVAVDLQEELKQLAEPQNLLKLESEDLARRLSAGVSLFEALQSQIKSNLHQLQQDMQAPILKNQDEALEKIAESIQVFADAPWAAAQTHANATPDLVLNTYAG